ncbi:CobW/P47K family protein [Planoprotostelium fungivorum]|uniref:CobW/P47K family protein n=1 Tax=Planoprotostelium fungivorum TaxID=1890364 RepID=A0A2P6MWE7_9EUKA|nr:CobW/P47K family protein [Planoprotostelium fungivorum]
MSQKTHEECRDSCCGGHKHHHEGKSMIPVTIFCGLNHSGKTSAIATLLSESSDNQLAVIMNDMLKKKPASQLPSVKDVHQIIEMKKGCVCCTLYEDFIRAMFSIKEGTSMVVVEATGCADVRDMGEVMLTGDSEALGRALTDCFRLDAIVAFVNVKTFFEDLNSLDYLLDRKEATDETDFRNIPSVLVEHIEHADVIVLGKSEGADVQTLRDVRNVISVLNPTARRVELPTKDPIALSGIFDTELYDFEMTQMKPGWIRLIRDEMPPSPAESNVSHFVFRSRRPFHPLRLYELIDASTERLPGVLRSRGFIWLASRHDLCGEWSSCGNLYSTSGDSKWFITVPREEWPTEDPKFLRDFEEPYGDRRQEIAIIGLNLDVEKVEGELKKCLLTEQEMSMGPIIWAGLEDKFDPWNMGEDEDEDEDDEDNEEEEDGKEEERVHNSYQK